MVRENCGVVGIYSMDDANVVPLAIDALRALQHRGQEAWGIAVPNKEPLRRMGLVSASSSHFKDISEQYRSNCVIGHVRYSTIGKNNLENAQPLRVRDLCVAHNGTMTDATEIKNMVGGCSFSPNQVSDTLVATKRLVSLISQRTGLGDALNILKNEMSGSYCFTFISDDNSVYAARDSRGFRPMVLGHKKGGNSYIVTSESAAVSAIGATLVRDIRPGELVRMNSNGLHSEMFGADESPAHCSFEFTYFAHPSSRMEGINIYVARKQIGRGLAKKFPIRDADLVIPVPDSARPAALGYAQELSIPFDEGLLKDRYSKKGPLRSFIEPQQSDRVEINRWIIPIREIIQNRHVVVIDDSLVRGTSSRAIIESLRNSGARKISMLITYPPVMFPCYAGIDFPSREELATFTDDTNGTKDVGDIIEMVRQDIGADFLGYNDTGNLARSIGIPKNSMCFTCHTGDYSTLGIKP